MERDEKTVSKALTSVIGPGESEYYGESKTRRKITRWDWNDHAFLLSNEEGEYVTLIVVSSEVANAKGRNSINKDALVKARLLASVVRAPNGDLTLSEIPMVDQGPKGYCVPATFERAMRTMGIAADMYLLATRHAKLSGSPKPTLNRYLCMIIGYNETTQELAVTDSWGPRYALR